MNRTLCGLMLVAALFSVAPGGELPVAPQVSSGTAAVTLDGRQVFTVSERLLSLSAQERAQRISERILKLARTPLTDPDRIGVFEGESSSDICLGDFVIMSVTDKDASAVGTTRRLLAESYASRIRLALSSYRRDYNLRALLFGAGLAALVSVLFFLILKLLAGAYGSVLPRMERWALTNVHSVRIQQMELLNAGSVTSAITALIKGSRMVLTLALLYFYIPTVFSLFPWTRGFSPVLFGYVLHPLTAMMKAAAHYLPDLIFITVTVTVVHYLLNILQAVAAEVEAGRISFAGFYPDWARPTFQIVRFLIWAFTLVIIFPYLPGSGSPAFRGVSVFLGVLLSLGSSSAVGNAVAGLMLTYMRPFVIGDRVKIAETVGDVTEKTLLVTRIRTIKNVNITIPNALVLGSHIVNYSSLSGESGIILNTTVTIGYDAPWPKVHELLLAAAGATPDVLRQPGPFILQTALNDYNVSYELNVYTDRPGRMAGIYSALHENIQDKFNAAGVEIMSPAFTGIRDANAPAMPGKAAPGGAGFRLKIEGKQTA